MFYIITSSFNNSKKSCQTREEIGMDEQLRCDTAVASVVFGTLGGLGGWWWHWQIGWLASAAAGIGLGALLAVGLEWLRRYAED